MIIIIIIIIRQVGSVLLFLFSGGGVREYGSMLCTYLDEVCCEDGTWRMRVYGEEGGASDR